MTKPTKSQKNSFIFLETVFSILLLSSVIALFFNFKVSSQQHAMELQNIETMLLHKTNNEHISTLNQTISFVKNGTQNHTIHVSKTTYNDGSIKLVRYE